MTTGSGSSDLSIHENRNVILALITGTNELPIRPHSEQLGTAAAVAELN